MKNILFIFLLGALFLIPQQDKKVEEKKAEKAVKPASGSELQSAPLQGEFVYNPMGRRDPFWDLLKRNSSKLKKKRKAGLAGLDIDQLELEGIVKKNGEFVALLKGPDGRPYLVKKGDSVYDGEVLEIGSHMVKFKKILTIALGGTKVRTIIKRLNPEEEDERKNEN
ncbi:MAG: pilus assembly protein PilP [Candidatus Aminicenantes bacterium]|nr:pilus assembly protein PilP [Candidatus Aminicenantes bacterium]MCK5003773.1 pilus assembly protein PilP [Candidatus Aminicenantes bacterium]